MTTYIDGDYIQAYNVIYNIIYRFKENLKEEICSLIEGFSLPDSMLVVKYEEVISL